MKKLKKKTWGKSRIYFGRGTNFIKNNLKIIFLKNTLLFHINIKFFQNLKKKLNSVGVEAIDGQNQDTITFRMW